MVTYQTENEIVSMQNEIKGLSQSIAEKLPPMMVRTLIVKTCEILSQIFLVEISHSQLKISKVKFSLMIYFTYRLLRQGWKTAHTVPMWSCVVMSHSTTWWMRLDRFVAPDKCSQKSQKCQSKNPHLSFNHTTCDCGLKSFLSYTGKHWAHYRGLCNALTMILR